jgi:hypothetical protein
MEFDIGRWLRAARIVFRIGMKKVNTVTVDGNDPLALSPREMENRENQAGNFNGFEVPTD